MTNLDVLIKSGLFSGISPEDYKAAYEELTVTSKIFKEGETILSENEIADKIYIIKTGCVRSEKDDEDIIMQIYDQYALVGMEAVFSTNKTEIMNYISHEDTEVIILSPQELIDSPWSKEFKQAIVAVLASENEKRLRKVNLLAHRSLRDRIMIYLDITQKKMGREGKNISIKMTQDQLAKFLSVNRSALSNELNKLKREKVIDFNKDEFRILKKI